MASPIELSERQQSVLSAFKQLRKSSPRSEPITARLIATALGVDSRGVGQTLRRIRDNDALVVGPDENGGYKPTKRGSSVLQRLS